MHIVDQVSLRRSSDSQRVSALAEQDGPHEGIGLHNKAKNDARRGSAAGRPYVFVCTTVIALLIELAAA